MEQDGYVLFKIIDMFERPFLYASNMVKGVVFSDKTTW